MKANRIMQSSLQKLVVLSIILFLSSQAFCSDPNSSITTKKTQPQKQTEQKTLPSKTTRPLMSPSSFRPEMPFREAIEILRYSTKPPLNIVVLWKDLDENADITPDTPIGMNGLTRVPLKTHLSILLMSLSTDTAQLGYTVDGNVIIIGTKEALPKKLVTRVYDISDLVAPPSMGGMMAGMGMGMGMMPYGNMMGYGNMSPYGNMSNYGTYGTGLNQYGTGYNQGYMNQGYGYTNQGSRPYGYQTTPTGVGLGR